jgi:hypothetical protein
MVAFYVVEACYRFSDWWFGSSSAQYRLFALFAAICLPYHVSYIELFALEGTDFTDSQLWSLQLPVRLPQRPHHQIPLASILVLVLLEVLGCIV